MRKTGNGIVLRRNEAEFFIRKALQDINTANELIEKWHDAGQKYDLGEKGRRVWEQLVVQSINLRQNGLKALAMMLDSNDRKSFVESFGENPKTIPYEDDEQFMTWAVVASLKRRIYLDSMNIYQNSIKFDVVEV